LSSENSGWLAWKILVNEGSRLPPHIRRFKEVGRADQEI
jgi:hypothetical protein